MGVLVQREISGLELGDGEELGGRRLLKTYGEVTSYMAWLRLV